MPQSTLEYLKVPQSTLENQNFKNVTYQPTQQGVQSRARDYKWKKKYYLEVDLVQLHKQMGKHLYLYLRALLLIP